MPVYLPPRVYFEPVRTVHDDSRNPAEQRKRATYRPGGDYKSTRLSGKRRKRRDQSDGVVTNRTSNERRPAEESQRRTEGLKPVSRKQKVNEQDSSERARSLNPDANGAGESTKVSNVERRGKPSQRLMELFRSKATDTNDDVVHPG